VNCAIWKKNEATVLLKHSVDGEQKDLNVCVACADKHGLRSQLPLPVLTDFLFGVSAQADVPKADGQKVCATCHMHLRDLQKSNLLGCPDCYGTFKDDVGLMLESLQPSSQHFGKVPGAQHATQIEHFEALLKSEAASEHFEQAAAIRDRLRALRRDMQERDVRT
jgi:protein arginine kinase activator